MACLRIATGGVVLLGVVLEGTPALANSPNIAAPGEEPAAIAAPEVGLPAPRAVIPEAALAEARAMKGDNPVEAAALLSAWLREFSQRPEAPAALFELAELYDERLDRPQAALVEYERFLDRFPGHRLAMRAQIRREALRKGLGAGEAAYLEYHEIVQRGGRDPAGAEKALRNLLARVPELPGADEARFLLTDWAWRRGDRQSAFAQLNAIIEAHADEPAHPARIRALIEKGNRYIELEDYMAAVDCFDPVRAAAVPEFDQRIAEDRYWQAYTLWVRDRFSFVAYLWLSIVVVALPFVIAAGWGRWRQALLPVPLETHLLWPYALGCWVTVWQFTMEPRIEWAAILFGVEMLAFSYGAAVVARVFATFPPWAMALVTPSAGLTAIALAFLTIDLTGLLPQVVFNVRHGLWSDP